VTLAQALPEGSKMDWIIEKAIELGVSGFQPLAAQRCVVRLSAERAERTRALARHHRRRQRAVRPQPAGPAGAAAGL
jgi:RsmE family RNA methyltransferase